MIISEQIKALSNTLLFAAGIFLFAVTIHGPGFYKIAGLAALTLPAYALYRQALSMGSIKEIFVESFNKAKIIKTILAALILGIASGIYHRYHATESLFPSYLTWFAFMAAAIGITEEIIFRGVAFFLLKPIHLWLRVMATAFLHAGYKALLFVPEAAQHDIEIRPLFMYTFLAGLVLGALRIRAGHIAPPVAAHALWDMVVYGESPDAPWWVW